MTSKKILIADDDAAITMALNMLLCAHGYEVTTVGQPQEALFYLKKDEFDLAILDLNYQLDTTSGQEGLKLIESIRAEDEHIPIVIMTGWATIDIAVKAMQNGANDFIEKPWDNNRLLNTLSNQFKLADSLKQNTLLTEENHVLKGQLKGSSRINFIAESEAMKQLMTKIEQIACADVNVLITGENGTGKSVLANHIHELSKRSAESFISVNMGAIPENLFESELFGHVKGAFTDAKADRIGRIELADKGTLFMDEVGNIPVSQQAKLLRVLEERRFEKVGASKTQQADMRVVAATNADLKAMVEGGEFRMDLLYRLNTVEFRIPSLKERLDDLPLLAAQLIDKFSFKYHKPVAQLSPNALSALMNYSWPGNLRELSHVLERAMLFNQSGQITADDLMLMDLPQATNELSEKPEATVNRSELNSDDLATMESIETDVISQRLRHFNGNANQAAKSLGLSRSAFYRRLDKYNL